MSDAMIEGYVDKVMANAYGKSDLENEKDGKAKTIALTTKATLMDAAYNGSGTKELGIGNTMYAVFNGIEEAIEHSLGGNRVKDRGYNILFGTGKAVADKAYNTAIEFMAA